MTKRDNPRHIFSVFVGSPQVGDQPVTLKGDVLFVRHIKHFCVVAERGGKDVREISLRLTNRRGETLLKVNKK